jgi:hypothetical protein
LGKGAESPGACRATTPPRHPPRPLLDTPARSMVMRADRAFFTRGFRISNRGVLQSVSALLAPCVSHTIFPPTTCPSFPCQSEGEQADKPCAARSVSGVGPHGRYASMPGPTEKRGGRVNSAGRCEVAETRHSTSFALLLHRPLSHGGRSAPDTGRALRAVVCRLLAQLGGNHRPQYPIHYPPPTPARAGTLVGPRADDGDDRRLLFIAACGLVQSGADRYRAEVSGACMAYLLRTCPGDAVGVNLEEPGGIRFTA